MPRKAKPAPASENALGAGLLPDLGCACASARRAARLVTQLYGYEMGNRVQPSQFALLAALDNRPGCSQTLLGGALGLDKTTLSRNLRLMQRNGWIELVKAEDQRERGYRLTSAGEELLNATKPGWKRAQEKLRAAMGAGEWENMLNVFGLVARAAQEARAKS
jgi:DNA-binding MarR family transcriptional regulator